MVRWQMQKWVVVVGRSAVVSRVHLWGEVAGKLLQLLRAADLDTATEA